MKKFVYLVVLISLSLEVYAQHDINNLSEEFKNTFNEAINCRKNGGESCLKYYRNLLEIAQKNKDCLPCAEIEMARGYQFEGKYDSSNVYINKVFVSAKPLNDSLKTRIELDAYNIMGANYSYLGKSELAIKNYIECGKRIDKLNLKEHSALLKVNIGLIYMDLKNYEKSKSLFKKALKELEDIGVERQTAIIYRNLINNYIALEQKDSALIYLPTLVKLATDQKSINSEVAAYNSYSQVYENTLPDSAIYYADKAITLAKVTNWPSQVAASHFVKAQVLSNQNNYSESKYHYLKAIDLYSEEQAIPVLMRVYNDFGKNALKFKDYETAATYFEKHIYYRDSIYKDENQKIIEELTTKYETAKKENQINLQKIEIEKQENRIQIIIILSFVLVLISIISYIFVKKNHSNKLKKIQQEKENAILNAFIKGEERERNRISHELHDGIASMISAAKMNLQALTHFKDEKKTEVLEKTDILLNNTHKEVRQLAHNLLPVTLEKMGIIKATQHFVSEINATKLLHISVRDHNSKADDLPKSLQLMLYRIVQELINNIIKHAQAKNATIVFNRNHNELKLEVNDDGIGYNQKEENYSQGIFSITQRLKSIGGNFKIVKGPINGTQAIAELKI